MPRYCYECPECGHQDELYRKVNGRNQPANCPSGHRMKRVPEHFEADTFEPYYDEGLGSDVHSEADRRVIMKEMGLVEAGDPVKGARNFDPKAPVLMDKQPLKGKRKRKAKTVDDSIVQTVDAEGKVLSEDRWNDLESPVDAQIIP